jgi:hypothetical protein
MPVRDSWGECCSIVKGGFSASAENPRASIVHAKTKHPCRAVLSSPQTGDTPQIIKRLGRGLRPPSGLMTCALAGGRGAGTRLVPESCVVPVGATTGNGRPACGVGTSPARWKGLGRRGGLSFSKGQVRRPRRRATHRHPVRCQDAQGQRVEGLRQIKPKPDLRTIPVVMLTSSREESDLVESYNPGGAAVPGR